MKIWYDEAAELPPIEVLEEVFGLWGEHAKNRAAWSEQHRGTARYLGVKPKKRKLQRRKWR